MGDVIRYGVIATGMMGFEHIRNLALVPDAKATAIGDPHEPSRRWGVQTAGAGVQVYEDHHELLAKAPVDAVVIATPNHAGTLAVAIGLAAERSAAEHRPVELAELGF
jgi:predicted dehydrogenase